MKDSVWIVVTKSGVDRMLKTGSFTLKSGERAFELVVEVPDAAFLKPPIPKVTMRVPAEALTTTIEAEVSTPVSTETPRRSDGLPVRHG